MKKTIALFTSLFMALSMSASNYGIFVKGIQVTDQNKTDVIGDGKVNYNPATKTLTLNNVRYYSNESQTLIIREDANVLVNGECSLTATNSLPVSIEECSVVFSGNSIKSSVLTAESNNGNAGVMLFNSNVTFQNMTVGATSTIGAGIAGFNSPSSNGTSTMTASKAVVKTNGAMGCICNLKALNLKGCSLDADNGYYFSACSYGVVNERNNSELVRGETLRIQPHTYSILVGGVQVNDANASDILGDGKVMLKNYAGSANKYLYFDNAQINSIAGSGVEIQTRFRVDLVFNGKNNVIKGQQHALYSSNNSMIQIRSNNTSFDECSESDIADVTFEVASGMSCVYVEKTNMSIFNTNITIKNGMYGIKNVASDYSVLNVCNSNVNIAGNSRTAISGFNTPYYSNCAPKGSSFSYKLKTYTSSSDQASIEKNLTIIRCNSLAVENENNANDAYNKAVSNNSTTASIF